MVILNVSPLLLQWGKLWQGSKWCKRMFIGQVVETGVGQESQAAWHLILGPNMLPPETPWHILTPSPTSLQLLAPTPNPPPTTKPALSASPTCFPCSNASRLQLCSKLRHRACLCSDFIAAAAPGETPWSWGQSCYATNAAAIGPS